MTTSLWPAILIAAFLVTPAFAQGKPDLATPREKGSYSIGVNTMSNLKKQGLDVDLDLMLRGMRDALSNGPYLLSDEEIRIAIKNYQTLVRRQHPAGPPRGAAGAAVSPVGPQDKTPQGYGTTQPPADTVESK